MRTHSPEPKNCFGNSLDTAPVELETLADGIHLAAGLRHGGSVLHYFMALRTPAVPFALIEQLRKLSVAALSGLIAVLLLNHNASAQETTAQEHGSLGIGLARQGKLTEAEQELREAVRMAPAVAGYRAQLASILGLLGKWNESLESFQHAIKLEPQNLDFRRETAAVQWQMGDMPAAEKNLEYVLETRPHDAGATLLLGLVKERTGEYAAAAELLDVQFASVISQPDRTVALFHAAVRVGRRETMAKIIDVLQSRKHDQAWKAPIGRCTRLAAAGGELDAARRLFALLEDHDRERAAAGLELGKALHNRGQAAQAQELLMQMAEQGIESADLQTLLGNCYEAQHQALPALKAYQRAIELEPSRVEYYQDPIALLLTLSRSKDAMKLIDHALAVAPNDARPWVWKGNASLRANVYRDALDSYTHASQLDASNAEAVLGRAGVYFVSGQIDQAIATYKTAMAQFPNDPRFYVACAEMYLASPDAAKLQSDAQRLLERAVQLAPESAEAHHQLGQIALQQGRLKDAESELSLSLKSEPDRSKTHFALSVVYRRLGRIDEAAKHFARYQQLKQGEDQGITAAISVTGKP
jgi:tetratricopeptide (TPR) repeat protein